MHLAVRHRLTILRAASPSLTTTSSAEIGENAAAKLLGKLFQKFSPLRSRLIHLIYKYKNRNPVMRQQLPKRHRMRLHAVCSAHDQNRIIQHLKRPLHLTAEIRVTGRVKQCKLLFANRKPCFFGVDRNAALPFNLIRIQKRVLMVDTPCLPNCAGQVQNRLR